MPHSFYTEPGLHVEIYDIVTSTGWAEAGTDVCFLLERFRNITGPLLELGCGTGRVYQLPDSGRHSDQHEGLRVPETLTVNTGALELPSLAIDARYTYVENRS
jgi:hypothetical protein